MKTDENIKHIVVAAIRRKSMEMDKWLYTQLWDSGNPEVKAKLSLVCFMETGELPILYSYIDAEDWTFVTTQRVLYAFEGETDFVFARDIIDADWGSFKGYNFKSRSKQETERMQIFVKGGVHLCPFETGAASMGTIYAVRTLRQIIKP